MAERRMQRILAWSSAGLATAVLAVTAYWLLFTVFMFYDDEGYVLLSLRNFSRHGALYDSVYSQYGPFPFLLYDALHRVLCFEFTNTTGRWITLVNWLGVTVACATLVTRFTRSWSWGMFTLVGVFAYLSAMINEPVHPGGLIVLLVAVAAWLGAEVWASGRISAFAGLMGTIAALLLLTKINVGIFFVGAVFTWLAVNSASAWQARILGWGIATGCAALPLVLMNALLDAPWVKLYAVIFACASLSTLIAARTAAGAVVTTRTWVRFAVVLFGVMFLVCAATLARGTSLSGLVNGIILEPLRHPGVYFFAMNWRDGSGVLALASLAAAAWAAYTGRWNDRWFVEVVAWARLLAMTAFVGAALGLTSTRPPGWGMTYGVAIAWLFIVPLRPGQRTAAARAWIGLLLVWQFLHAYPVAGSQINWGTFLWVPLLALGTHEAVLVLSMRVPLTLGRWPARIGVAVLIAVSGVAGGKLFHVGWTHYSTSQPLGLRGAEALRMPDNVTYILRILDENLRAHADMLVSAPGLYSANLWTGLPTPTLANATHWFSLLSTAQQQEIISRLETAPRAALLVQRGLLDFLVKNGFTRRGPLQGWLMSNFEKTLDLYPYEIWMRRGRTIAPLSTARLRSTEEGRLVGFSLILRAPAKPVAQIDICDVLRPHSPLVTLNAENTRSRITPIDLDGKPIGPATESTFPLELTGVVEIAVDYSGPTTDALARGSLIILRDAEGEILSELRVLPPS